MKTKTTATFGGKSLVVDVGEDGTIRVVQAGRRTGYSIPAGTLYGYLVQRHNQGLSGSTVPLEGAGRGDVVAGRPGERPIVFAGTADVKACVRQSRNRNCWEWMAWVDVGSRYTTLALGHNETEEAAQHQLAEFMRTIKERFEFRE
jgi:hypothetical protein